MTMMAIGDSLYNGVRSLTINQALARWSVPAQVARALGTPFAIPDYPRNVVIDMERWLTMFPDVGSIAQDLSDNIDFWMTAPKTTSGATEFDNIAIASTTFEDMWQRNWQTADHDLQKLKSAYGAHLNDLGGPLSQLFFDFNTRFLLNPTGNPNAPAESPLDIVARRQPQRLLSFIGSNNGLWEICFDANPTGAFTAQDFASLNTYMEKLASLPSTIRHIYVNTLALPSTVSNLMPTPDDAINNKPPPGQFFANYENRFGFSYGTYTAQGIAAVNARIAQVNDAIIAAAARDPRIHVVRTDILLQEYDAKHRADAWSVQVPYGAGQLSFTNVMTEANPWPIEPSFKKGGLQGLDGMHPTIVGYTAIAQAVLDAIALHEDIHTAPLDFSMSDRADSLLTNTPRSWSYLLWLWRDLRQAEALGNRLVTDLAQHIIPLRGLMQALQFKTN